MVEFNATKRFLLVGNGPYSNRGCEAIVRGTIEILSRRFVNASVILSSFGEDALLDARSEIDARIQHKPHGSLLTKKYSPAWWNYRVLHRRTTDFRHIHFRAQYEGLMKSACVLQIGGDNYSMDHHKPYEHMLLDNLLMSSNKPVVLWGASIGPPLDSDKVYEQEMMNHLRRFDLILARETKTVQYLADCGVTQNVKLVADPAFLLAPSEPSLNSEMSQFLQQAPIGLNLSPIVSRFREQNVSDWLQTTRECISSLLNSGTEKILLVPHVTVKDGNDYTFMLQAMNGMTRARDRIKILPDSLSASEYKWVIGQLPLFIGARTHSTIAALSSGVPTISIGYSIKATGINQDVYGHTDWCIPIHQVEPGLLAQKVSEAYSKRDEMKAILLNRKREMQAQAHKAADYLADVLD